MGVERFGVALNGDVLHRKMAERGLTGAALAKGTGLSEGTISNALAGRRLHPHTYRLIAGYLAKIEVVPGAELLAEVVSAELAGSPLAAQLAVGRDR